MLSRRKRKRRDRRITASVLIAAAVGALWVFFRADSGSPIDPTLELGAHTPIHQDSAPTQPTPAKGEEQNPTAEKPKAEADSSPPSEKDEGPQSPTSSLPATSTGATQSIPADSLVESAKSALARNDLLTARSLFSQAMQRQLDAAQRDLVRDKLEQLSADMILGPRILPNDPLVERYVVKDGDLLANIAKANKVSAGLLSRINGLGDPNMIRVGQTLKVIKGPFRGVVDKSAYTLDVYLGDTFMRQFRVGLGADDSTPTGEWLVANKLKNPTYYPPRGGKVIAADDPQNPLGEHWIGLRGVSGEALGQERYGIHGTIEPESIGKNASLGCVRLLNEEVEFLYQYLVEQHSTVTVK